MQVRKVYAVVSVANLDIAHAWYTQLLGRPSDRHRAVVCQQRQEDREEEVDVPDRIPAQSAGVQRGAITLSQCRPPVCDLMRDHREQHHGRDEEEYL